MRKITDIISKPSEALQAMVDGLLKQSERDDFEIDMDTYGDYKKSKGGILCFGCAATCTLQQLSGSDFEDEEIADTDDRANFLRFDFDQMDCFEGAINMARQGNMTDLFMFFSIDTDDVEVDLLDAEWCLGTDSWREQLPDVQKHIELLISKGY